MEEFGRRLQVVARGIAANVHRAVRKAALTIDQVLVLLTPVDTGRARANWVASLVAPREDIPSGPQPGESPEARGAVAAQVALDQARGVVSEYGGGSIFIANNVPYIGPLDEGHSRQAPAGMTSAALAAGEEVFRQEKVLPR